MYECRQGFIHTKRELRSPLLPDTSYTYGTVSQPHYVEISSQGVMSSMGASNNPGLYPVKG